MNWTHQELDLLGCDAMGGRGCCGVGRFALPAGVHGFDAPELAVCGCCSYPTKSHNAMRAQQIKVDSSRVIDTRLSKFISSISLARVWSGAAQTRASRQDHHQLIT